MAYEIDGAEIERELRQHLDRVHGPAPDFDARPELATTPHTDGSSGRNRQQAHRHARVLDNGLKPEQATAQDR
ncbi:hypothetical protein CKO28_01655 [Rhodovibrio sodomensis]|uniref:Uncharacterized protein n=1 Tax=Rhodovibrio sodomensis TaxID=1088 RepID=A0ABS1D928_9PROT|nr:hypothetical protein [Rhodovibrio sodomensis]MBK1666749.1 hypothetical protein [Rhodovibrio sodomensis]